MDLNQVVQLVKEDDNEEIKKLLYGVSQKQVDMFIIRSNDMMILNNLLFLCC